MKKIFTLTVLLMFCSLISIGQTDFSIHFGGLKPTGYYGYENNENSLALYSKHSEYAGTGLGLNAGAKLRFSITKVKGLGVIGSLDVFYNGLNKENKELFEETYKDTYPIEDKFYDIRTKSNYPNIINLPIMLGVNYQYGINENISLWAECAFGLNYRMITSHKYKMSYKWDYESHYYGNADFTHSISYKLSYNFKNNVTFGRQIGFGVMFAQRFSIGLHYYNLGGKSKSVISEYEWSKTDHSTYNGGHTNTKDVEDDITGGKFNASMLVLRFGIHF